MQDKMNNPFFPKYFTGPNSAVKVATFLPTNAALAATLAALGVTSPQQLMQLDSGTVGSVVGSMLGALTNHSLVDTVPLVLANIVPDKGYKTLFPSMTEFTNNTTATVISGVNGNNKLQLLSTEGVKDINIVTTDNFYNAYHVIHYVDGVVFPPTGQ